MAGQETKIEKEGDDKEKKDGDKETTTDKVAKPVGDGNHVSDKSEEDEETPKKNNGEETKDPVTVKKADPRKMGLALFLDNPEKMTKVALIEELKKLELPTDGNKPILVERLKTALLMRQKKDDLRRKKKVKKKEIEEEIDSLEEMNQFFDDPGMQTLREVRERQKEDLSEVTDSSSPDEDYYPHHRGHEGDFRVSGLGASSPGDSSDSSSVASLRKSWKEKMHALKDERSVRSNSRSRKARFVRESSGGRSANNESRKKGRRSRYESSDDSDSSEERPSTRKLSAHKQRDKRRSRANSDDRRSRQSSERHDKRQRQRSRGNRTKTTFSIRDVEGCLTDFTGDEKVQPEKWLEEFEDVADLLEWDDLQMIIYAKRMLKGSAKKYMATKKISTWRSFKRALVDEFAIELNSAAVHTQLSQRKRSSKETSKQYVYAMMEIAAQGDVDDTALIEYIIAGIPDYESNKSILYGARTLKKLKRRLEDYDKMKEKSKGGQQNHKKEGAKGQSKDTRSSAGDKQENYATNKKKDPDRCFNCGKKGHEAADCEDKDKGPKCFKCNEFGHIAPKCTKEKPRVGCVSLMDDKLLEVEMVGKEFRALVDTGSDVNLMQADVHKKIGNPPMNPTSRTFIGLGNQTTKPLGSVVLEVKVDNQPYHTLFYVIPNGAMTADVILGQEWMKGAEIVINQGKIKVRRAVERDTGGPEVPVIPDEQNPLHEELVVLECVATREIEVPELYRAKVEKLLADHQPRRDVKTSVETKIVLKDDQPVCLQPRRLSVKEKRIIDEQVEEWLADGIIRPSTSEYASPALVTPKKDGSYRVCIDYRMLNKKIIRDRFPMPLIDDRIDALSKFRVFSVLDLKNGFFHVPVAEESIKFTAFVTPDGQFEYLKTPFGLCISPTSFLRYIDRVFRELIRRNIVFTYMDDLIVPGLDDEEAFNRLVIVMEVAAENGLNFNLKKCKFLQRKVEYLGHVIENGTVAPSPGKVEAVKRFPEPKTGTQLKSFLGLTSYFRKFIKDYAKIAYPLYEVRDGPNFLFGNAQKLAFQRLKEALICEPILRIYDPEAITEVHTDASKLGYGAVLLQKQPGEKYFHPVYYMSRKTSEAQKKWCSYELEVLAIIEALKKFRVYVLGLKFKIVTDCQAFEKTLSKQNLPPKVARWAISLEEFDYEIEHRSGDRMKHVDALSRYPIMAVEDPMLVLIRSEQAKEERLNVIRKILATEQYEGYVIENGVLMKKVGDKNLVVLPTSLQHDVLRRTHENGHFGLKKMMEALQNEYYIPKLKEKLERLVECCVPCTMAEKKRGRKEGLLQPIPKGDRPFDTFHIDHLGPMTATSKLYKHLFVVVDGFTKFTWIFPTKTTGAHEVLAKMEMLQQWFGNARRIISDQGPAFTSNAFEDWCRDENIEHVLVTTGVPRGNGQVERINRIIIPVLAKLSMENPDRWYQHVRRLQMCLNSTHQRSIGMSPFEVLFGVKMRQAEDLRIAEVLEQEAVALFDEEREALRQTARENILKVQAENKRNHDERAREATKYKVGDLVVIQRTQFAPNLKIQKKFLGPYKVTKVIGHDRYEVVRVGNFHEDGPKLTSSSADHMKRYNPPPETEGFPGWPNEGSDS